MRYPRGTGPGVAIQSEMTAIPLGKAQVRRKGSSGLLILAFGALVRSAEIIGERLDATVVNMRFVKPLDEDLVLSLARAHTALVTIEENAVQGGAGSACLELLANCESALPSLPSAFPTGSSNTVRATIACRRPDSTSPSLEAAVRRFWEHRGRLEAFGLGDLGSATHKSRLPGAFRVISAICRRYLVRGVDPPPKARKLCIS